MMQGVKHHKRPLFFYYFVSVIVWVSQIVWLAVRKNNHQGWQMTDQIRTVGSLKEKNSHCWWQTNQKDVSFHFWDGNRWRFSQPEWVCNPWIIRDCCVPWNHESNKGMTDEPPKRKLSIVVQTPSCQLNAACIPLEMKDSCTVNSTRQLLLSREFLP